MPFPTDYLADYRVLGCAPGCSAAELERAWRAALRTCHPDRAVRGREAEAAARTQALNTAYRRLREFEQRHGRLPGASATPAAAEAAAASPAAPGEARPAPRRRRRWAALAAVLGAVALSAWLAPQPTPQAEADPASGALDTAPPAAGTSFTLDSHADEVIALAGEPMLRQGDLRQGELWEYGPSYVSFRARRVVDWYSSPLRPLPVASERPPPALTAPPSRK